MKFEIYVANFHIKTPKMGIKIVLNCCARIDEGINNLTSWYNTRVASQHGGELIKIDLIKKIC